MLGTIANASYITQFLFAIFGILGLIAASIPYIKAKQNESSMALLRGRISDLEGANSALEAKVKVLTREFAGVIAHDVGVIVKAGEWK